MLCQCGIVTIAIYGFLKNFCPDGYYLSNILFSPPKNLTVDEVTQDVYPVMAGTHLFFTFVALLITDILQYKTIIVIGALASAIKCPVLYFGTTLTHIQISQSLYTLYKASQVAYRTYIYTQVQKHNYQQVTAVVHITPKLGTLFSALLAQFLLSSHIIKLENLILISFVGLGLSFIIALALPSVEGTVYSAEIKSVENQGVKGHSYQHAAGLLWEELRHAAGNINTLKWCIWWILSNGAFQLVSDYYVQALWNDVTGEKENTYNAGVEAIYACCSATVCVIVGRLEIDWQKHGEMVIVICTLFQAAVLLGSAHASSIVVSYSLYVTASIVYDMMTVISNSQIALKVKNDGFGLIFGINTFLSIGFQAILTYVLTSKNTFALAIREQFVSVAVCFAILGLIFLAKTFSSVLSSTHPQLERPNQPEELKINGVIKTISVDVYTGKSNSCNILRNKQKLTGSNSSNSLTSNNSNGCCSKNNE